MTDLNLAHAALLAAAAFGAGVLNAIAGGGTFLTFPALVATGVPPIAANATSAFAVAPGYLGSTWGFRQELGLLPRARLLREALIAMAGGIVGGWLLLRTPAKVFLGVVPVLLLAATLLFAAGPWLNAWRARRAAAAGVGPGSGAVTTPGGPTAPAKASLGRNLGLFAVAVYGGYFNGGLGILLMALYLVTGELRLTVVNALKNLNSWMLSLVSVAVFALGGAIVWPQALWMAAWATGGGYAGAHLGRRLPAAVVRAVVIAIGLGMTVVFALRLRG